MNSATTLKYVSEGMKVFDSKHHEIGKVELVQFGDDDPDLPDVEAAGPSGREPRNDSLIENIAEAFHPDELPEAIRERLLHEGFVRLDADGLFAADRYILPEQIDSVSADGLMLNVTKDELVKRH